MQIKFWGTRGSLPRAITHDMTVTQVERLVASAKNLGLTSLDQFLEALRAGSLASPAANFGGNTTCNEITHGGQAIYVDMGSGAREAGTYALSQQRTKHVAFLTHLHWDHIMGLPFFVPIYMKGMHITLYHVHKNAPEYLRLLFNGVNYPVKWAELGATIEFKQLKLYEPVAVGDLNVTAFTLDHPGGSFGYRIDGGGKAISIGVDSEYKRTTPKELGRDLKYYQNLDALVFDAQYELSELASRYDWGHSSPAIGVDLALREGIRNVFFTHHDPWSSEEKITQMYEQARQHASAQLSAFKDVWDKSGQAGPNLHIAYDGLQVAIDKL